MDTSKGIIKFYNVTKGYGFIVDQSGSDLFFHVTSILEEVKKDDMVSYVVKETKKGMSAVDVKKC